MAYPLSASVVQQAYTTITNDLQQLKASCQALQAATASSQAAPAYLLLNLAQACISYRTDFATIAGDTNLTNQLVPYIQAQLAGATALSVTSEFVTLNTLAGNLLNAAAADYPHDGSGRLLDRTFSLVTGIAWVTLTAAQMPTTMPAVTALLAELT